MNEFTEATLLQNASQRSVQRGKQLYRQGNVQSLQVLDGRVKAYVQGSGWKCYNVDIKINEETGCVTSSKCDCPASTEYIGLCKHAVATVLRYIQVKKDQAKKMQEPVKKITVEIPDRSKINEKLKSLEESGLVTKGSSLVASKESSKLQMPKTDSGLYRILLGRGKDKQLWYRQNNIRGRVKLEPYYSDRYGKSMVEFKIGISQMYVLKNILEFAKLMSANEHFSYGTKLEFYHHISAFEKDSIPLLKFILECANDFNTIGGMNVFQYYTRNDVKREMPLRGNHLDKFFECMIGKKIFMEHEVTGYNKEFLVTDEKPVLYMRIEGQMAGIRVYSPKIQMGVGTSYQYIYNFRDCKIHRVALESIEKIVGFQQYMNSLAGNAAFIAEKELPIFCRDFLPELQKIYEVEILEFNPEKYLPDDVKFEIYLDMPENDCITCSLMAVYGEDKYKVFSIDKDRSKFIELAAGVVTEKRDVEKELYVDSSLALYFPAFDVKHKIRYLSGNMDEIYEFLSEGINDLEEFGDVYISDKMKRAQILKTPAFSVGVSIKSGLLELSLESKDMPLEELAQILTKYNRKTKYYRLKDGSFINMQDEEMENLVSLVDGLQLSFGELKKGEILLPKYRALYVDSLSKVDGVNYFHKDNDFKKLVRNMKSIDEVEYEVPSSLDSIMREYQKSGYRWLHTLAENGFGGILADDMGLGKTLQVISFLVAKMEERCDTVEGDDTSFQIKVNDNGLNRRTLIVCPASLVYNWDSELERFAPELNRVTVTGDVMCRREIIQNAGNRDILITSYDLLKRDLDYYKGVDFFCEIIDEAQYIKNHATQAARAVKAISAGTRFALTGTPMENRLCELWSIFDYLMPGFLFGYKQFREDIESPIVDDHDEDAMLTLRRFITPFVLRRLKKDVLKDLPDKMEEIVYAKMEEEQQKLYEASAQNLKMMLGSQSDKEFSQSKIQVLAELTKLRQLCCNPSLLYDDYKGGAAKVDTCMELVNNAIEGGHKILIFSQFTSMLELLEAQARKLGIGYYKLTGQTSKEDRITMVDAFNKDDTSVFFISLKAGGTGLNLTSADIVIHFDPWWNLAAQNQATDRTHRIGQTNVVTVYKLIAKNTIEEKIVLLQEMKQELADKVLGGEDMDKATFSKEELMELLG